MYRAYVEIELRKLQTPAGAGCKHAGTAGSGRTGQRRHRAKAVAGPEAHGEGLQKSRVVEPVDERQGLDVFPERSLGCRNMAALKRSYYRVCVAAPVEAA